MRRKAEFQGDGTIKQSAVPMGDDLLPPPAAPTPAAPVAPAATPPPAAAAPLPMKGYTGTTCPVCRLAQWYVPGGVTCPNGHCFRSVEDAKAGKPHMTLADLAKPAAPAPVAPPPAAAAPTPPVHPWKPKAMSVCNECYKHLGTRDAARCATCTENALAANPSWTPTLPTAGIVASVAAPEPPPATPAATPAPEPVATPAPAPKRSRSAARRSDTTELPLAPAPATAAPAPEPMTAAPAPAPEPPPVSTPVVVDRFPEADSEPPTPHQQRREKVAASIDELVLGPGYDRIVERVFAVDPWASYEQLERDIKLPGPAHRADYATIVDALDKCEDNAREAHRVFIAAKVAADRFEADAIVLAVDMRTQATQALEAEKERGERKKQITDADVESRIAALFPDEWRTLEERRAKARRMVSHLERLADLWKERARDVRAMLETMRR